MSVCSARDVHESHGSTPRSYITGHIRTQRTPAVNTALPWVRKVCGHPCLSAPVVVVHESHGSTPRSNITGHIRTQRPPAVNTARLWEQADVWVVQVCGHPCPSALLLTMLESHGSTPRSYTSGHKRTQRTPAVNTARLWGLAVCGHPCVSALVATVHESHGSTPRSYITGHITYAAIASGSESTAVGNAGM